MIDSPVSSDSGFPSPVDGLASALKLLHSLINFPDLRRILDPNDRPTTRMVYTNCVTLWLLILQRLGKGKSLSEVVS